MHKYIIVGVQGCGKGTQAQLLVEKLDIVHISVGDMFRWHVKNHTKIGARVIRHMNAGELVPDELVEEMMRKRLALHDWNYGFILDGFPRNVDQARFFLENFDIDAVIHIQVSDATVKKRILSRKLCSQCGVDYNLMYHRPQKRNQCDICGGKLIARPDDTPTALKKRLEDFHTKTEPVLKLFRAKRLVIDVNGEKDKEAVHKEIWRNLRKIAGV